MQNTATVCIKSEMLLHLQSSHIFSLVVFKENIKVLSQTGCRRWRRRLCQYHHAQTLTFSNIAVITEDFYLKLKTIKRETHTSRRGNLQFFST